TTHIYPLSLHDALPISAKATVFAVGLGSAGAVDAGSLQAVASATGGQYVEAADGAAIPNGVAKAVGFVGNQVQITYVSDANGVRSEEHTSELQSRGHLV